MIRAIGILLVFAVVFSTLPAPACGPFFEVPVFEPEDRPAAPSEFLQERPGIILGTYRIPYLIAAWRVLSGKSADPESAADNSAPDTPFEGSLDKWLKARSAVSGNPPQPISANRKIPGEDFQYYANCPDGAFENAASTLGDRIKRFGVDHAGVRRWIQAQDVVFGNCSEGSAMVTPPEPGLEPLLAADRNYQTAAALFYSGEFQKARALWLEIAEETTSPWQKWGAYLAARCLIREATLGKPEESRPLLVKAEQELKAITSNADDREVKQAAAGIADWVAAKLRPVEQMAVYASRLEGSDHISSDLSNLLHLWRVLDNSTFRPTGESELLDWLFAMRGQMESGEIIVRWRASTSSAWLLAALHGVKPDETPADLLQAAAAVEPGSPAFATAAWARVRLEQKDPVALRNLVDSLLPDLRRSVPGVALNWFLRNRLAVARNFEEFVRFAPRLVAAESYDGLERGSWPATEARPKVLLDRDGEVVINRFLPLARWREIIEGRRWTPHLRARLVRAGFVRALLSGDEKNGLALAARLRSDIPSVRELVAGYENVPDAAARQFAGVWMLLKLPGLQPDIHEGFDRKPAIGELDWFRDNWWCSTEEQIVAPPGWIAKSELLQAQKERDAGNSLLSFATPVVTAWVEKNAGDPRAPEALASLVRVSRNSCRDANTGRYSKKAFTILHTRFPDSEWAKRTPYWYSADY